MSNILAVLYKMVGKNKDLPAARRRVRWPTDSRFLYPPSCHHVQLGANARPDSTVSGRVLHLR